MATKTASSRSQKVTPTDNGNILDFGPAGTSSSVSTFAMQFVPSVDFVGSFTLLGKLFGPAAACAPMLPIAYRRVNVAGAASDYALATDPIAAVGLIQVPCNGLSLGLLVTCTAGTCGIYSWDLQGPSSI